MHLGQQTVAELMTKVVPTVERTARIEEILEALVEHDSSFVVVLDEGQPVGMVTERTLLPKVTQSEQAPKGSLLGALFHSLGETMEHASELRRARATTAEEAMSTPLVTIDPQASVASAVFAGSSNWRWYISSAEYPFRTSSLPLLKYTSGSVARTAWMPSCTPSLGTIVELMPSPQSCSRIDLPVWRLFYLASWGR